MTPQPILRPLRVEDAEAMATVLAAPSLYEFTGGEPPTVAELTDRYGVQTRGYSSDGTERWINLVVESDGEPVGYVQATVPTNGGAAEIAWVIGRPWQGWGLAREAARLLCEVLSSDGVTGVIAHIHPEHVASQRIAQGLGMQPTDEVVDGEVRWEGALPLDARLSSP